MALSNSSRDSALGWIWLSAIGEFSFAGKGQFGELGFEHLHQGRDIVQADCMKPRIARREARIRALVAQAEAGDGLEFHVQAALAQRRFQLFADLERAATPAARDEVFLAHVHAQRERRTGGEAFGPGAQQRLHSTWAPDSRMARPHFATSDCTNAPNSSGVELMASTPSVVICFVYTGSCAARTSSAFSRMTIGRGVAAGT